MNLARQYVCANQCTNVGTINYNREVRAMTENRARRIVEYIKSPNQKAYCLSFLARFPIHRGKMAARQIFDVNVKV